MTIGAEYGSFPYRSVTVGGETALSHAEQRTLTEIRRTVQHRGHYAWKKETSEYMIPNRGSAGLLACRRRAVPVRSASTRRSAGRNTIVEQATAKEITHEDVEMVRRFGAEFRRADESYVSALYLMAPVFELPLSDVTVVDGEKAVLECRVAATPAAEVTWYSLFTACLQRHFSFRFGKGHLASQNR